MFKKSCLILTSLLLLCGVYMSSVKPVFSGYSTEFEVYLNDSSSLASIKRVNASDFLFLKNVKGESVSFSANNFDLEGVLRDFNAKVLFVENTADGVCYYAFSPNIKYIKTVNGQTVNLHIALFNTRVTMGTPLIFGSF